MKQEVSPAVMAVIIVVVVAVVGLIGYRYMSGSHVSGPTVSKVDYAARQQELYEKQKQSGMGRRMGGPPGMSGGMMSGGMSGGR